MEKKEKDNEYVDFVVTARKYKTTLTAKYKNRKMWHKPFVGDVISHLPGTIVKVEVQQVAFDPPGDEDVQPGGRSRCRNDCRAGCNGRR